MAPFIVDPVSTFILPLRRKSKISHTTSHSTGSKLSKPAAIAIVVVVAVILIIAIIASILVQRRRKAKSKANKHNSTVPGYSADNSGGLYGGTPGYFAGRNGQQFNEEGAQEKQSMDPTGYQGEYGRTSTSGYRGVDHGGQGAAASYYAESQYAQHGVQGQSYGRGSHEMPQRPPMAFNPSPAQV
ncbi:hypothetical protein J7T55_012927 [Diaporthe amygdali]|uniref:uncharacterized protein n=1 Tax=Phomopsis amygdali TaxID=1214568 RepID=UPI0022FE2F1D|nr:uncharacterized protein J7T55_012927 [Diaporthe amygdali]KAJ0118673.1 hypothetical protein J7T55_012927 [Diaporthe amygdali]